MSEQKQNVNVEITAPPAYYAKSPGNGMAVTGFVLALCSYPLFFLFIPWILAIVFSGIGLYKSFSKGTGKGLSIAGLALSTGPAALFVLVGLLI